MTKPSTPPPIHLWFGRIAQEFPTRIAVEIGDRTVTFAHLRRRANAVAELLEREGCDKGTPVAFHTADVVEQIAAILGVLQIGGIFVPIDPATSEIRLREIFREASPAWALVDEALLGPLADAATADHTKIAPRILVLDRPASPETERDGLRERGFADVLADQGPSRPFDRDDPCYLYFTSGSTGRAKAILGRLKGIDHFVRWEIDTLEPAGGVRGSQLISPAFDAFLRDVFVPLCSGGTVCVPAERRTVLDGAELIAWLDASAVELIHCVPSLFRQILAAKPRPEQFAALRWILLSGEQLLGDDIGRWMDIFGERVGLINLYGASETTMTKLFHRVRPQDRELRSVPIGRPMRGAEAILLDEQEQLCPPGSVGQIVVRTPFRSHGYYGLEDLTRQVFVPNPITGDAADLVYLTGDFGRQDDEGVFEFLGRRDQQIKLRGVRIELSGIEQVLRRHPAVADAVVVERDAPDGGILLVAYVAAVAGSTTPAQLDEHLRAHLTEIEVPAACVVLDELPRTLTGKIDRRALPAPEEVQGGARTPPSTPIEKQLAEIWKALLRQDEVGLEDDFFASGGHSLLAIQLLARLRKGFEIDIPIHQILENRTLGGLARVVEEFRGGPADEAAEAIPAAPPETWPLPASFAQRRLWFLDRLEPGSPAYNIPVALHLRGALSVSALRASLAHLERRHETLRTRFETADGEPIQIVEPPATPSLPTVDLERLAVADRDREQERHARRLGHTPFDLARAPLARWVLLRRAPAEHVVAAVLHHAITDGWSMGVMIRELARLYRALAEGVAPSLPSLPIRYTDYAVWQQSAPRREARAEDLRYWTEVLRDVPALDLATDRPRPERQTSRGGAVPVAIAPATVEALEALARRGEATLFMVLLASFHVLLNRYSGQDDLAIGTVVSGRERLETEGLIGYFANTLALRMRGGRRDGFDQLLARVRRDTEAAYGHQELPFEHLVEELHPSRSLSRTPIFQVMLVLQNARFEPIELPGLTFEPVQVAFDQARFELSLDLTQTAQGLHGILEFNSDLFDRTTAARLAAQWGNLLGELLEAPTRPLGALRILSRAERHQLECEWNDTRREPATDELLDLLAQPVERAPDAVAVVDGDRVLTYGELWRRAGLLAGRLRRLGAGPETPVGLFLERSAEMVTALLAVVRSGAAYVPLDPSHPLERLRFLVEDARPVVVLTRADVASRLDGIDAPRLVLDAEGAMPEALGADGPPLSVDADAMAYILYTSGSTGRPKGVMVPRRAMVERLRWMAETFPVDGEQAVLHKASLGFDVSVYEIFWPLCGGARLVIAPPGSHRDPAALAEALVDGRIAHVDMVPSLLRAFLDLVARRRAPRAYPALRRVVTGGEAVSFDLELRYSLLMEAPLYNFYGPTETTVDVSWWRCQRRSSRPVVPIGRPVPGTRLRLLDGDGRPVPVLVAGHLHVGGLQVARGYLGRPGLTAASFVPDPLAAEWGAGARCYRTGDLARRLADGSLEFLGRIDHQIKLRGVRVELGEIEEALRRHAAVEQAAVVVARRAVGEDRLVAFLKPIAADAAPDREALRRHLAAHLPEHMVPAAFVVLDALPRIASGKLDRRALENSAVDRSLGDELEAVSDGAHERPATPLEEIVAGLWAETLEVREVGLHDDFFSLGGHSLLATRLLARLRDQFRVELDLGELFERLTVADCAAKIERLLRGGEQDSPPPLMPGRRDGAPPLSFAQERLWFLARLEPAGAAAYNVPVAMRWRGRLDVALLGAALDRIVRRHEILRTSFPAPDGVPVQRIEAAGPSRLPVVDLEALGEARAVEESARLEREQALAVFDLARPPVRTVLVRRGPGEHVLLLTLHHILADGWSMEVMAREMADLYRAGRAGEPSPLEPLGLQYADYALHQRQWLSGEILEREAAVWRQRLGGAPTSLDLPIDFPRPPLQTYRGAQHLFYLPTELRGAVVELGRARRCTLFMSLMAAFQVLLGRYCNQRDLLLGIPISGRRQSELEPLIGLFLNTLVLRGDLRDNPTFEDFLGRAREEMLSGHANQHMPFGKMVELLDPERHLDRSPLFQALFTLLPTTPTLRLELPEVEVEVLRGTSRTAKVEINLEMVEVPRGLLGVLEYNTDLFDAVSMERLAGALESLLAAAVREPAARVLDLPLLSASAAAQALDAWQGPTPADDLVAGVHQRIARRAEGREDAIAVEMPDMAWSYRRLLARSRHLAAHLRSLGVGPEVLVGVYHPLDADTVTALLAVWMAGGAYVPLDPDYPEQRLGWMMEDSGLGVLLLGANDTLPESLAEGLDRAGVRRVALDAPQTWSADDPGAPPRPASPDSLAYVLYTSGSTGRPKGVQISHGALANFLDSMARQPGMAAERSLAPITPLSFDIAGLEIYLPLLVGGRLVLLDKDTLRDGPRLVGALHRHRVDVLQATPATWRLLVDSGIDEPLGIDALCGGEALPLDLARWLVDHAESAWNLYGPTETTIWSSVWRVRRDALVTLGRPIDRTRFRLLDDRGRWAATGAAAELAIGGTGVARGYHGRAALTAERFVPDAWSDHPGERLYRTGDLVRERPSGELEFLGRRDHQVKVRGFRIELGEIEAALVEHPGIAVAVVTVTVLGPSDARLVAHLKPRGGAAPEAAELRAFLRERLPERMVPAMFHRVDEMPLTPAGKIDRAALGREQGEGARAVAERRPTGNLETAIAEIWKEVLGVERVSASDSFFDLGGHSLLLPKVQTRLREGLGVEISLLDLFRHPSVERLARYLEPTAKASTRGASPRRSPRRRRPDGEAVAVIGMAGRFPGASDLDAFWSNLRLGVESVSRWSDEELARAGVGPNLLADPNYVKARAVVADAELFDAQFFGLSPTEAQILDPQHRLCLEVAWEAMENAAYDTRVEAIDVGVFGGTGMGTYIVNLMTNPQLSQSVGPFQLMISNDKDYMPTRLAYKLHLTGPAINIQTACSTSLVAVHLACRSLLRGECDIALAGGGAVSVPRTAGYLYQEGGILSPDGHCRAFDAQGQGTVDGEGVAFVVLKPLQDALADGDTVRAVIRGSAINNDGETKIGYTAPSIDGQARAIREALRDADVDPSTIDFIETHGTATALGDPIEVAALHEVFGGRDPQGGSCTLGAVKTNIGHADAAAGVAGLIKTVLALEAAEIPPTLHFHQPNPRLELDKGPFRVNAELQPWPRADRPRRAGVSSFGVGGTNAHVVVEQAPSIPASDPAAPRQLLVLSAQTPEALDEATERLAAYLGEHLAAHLGSQPELNLADVAYTCRVGRRAMRHRRILVADSVAQAVELLRGRPSGEVFDGIEPDAGRVTAWMFSGVGDHYPQMGRELYEHLPVFRRELDRCCDLLAPQLGEDPRELLYPASSTARDVKEGGAASGMDLRRLLGRGGGSVAGPLRRTSLAQPLVCALEIALARQWQAWGIEPEAVIGYSLGEYAAACVAGVFSVEDALRLVATRARLIDSLPQGAMLAVPLPADQVEALLAEFEAPLDIAVVANPRLTVVAGATAAVEALEARLERDEIVCRRLETTHAFHSRMMRPIAERFAEVLAEVTLRPPSIPCLSNVTGTWMRAEDAVDPDYWVRHLVGAVRFGEGLAELLSDPRRVLLEIGPGQALSTSARQHPAAGLDHVILPSMRDERQEESDLGRLLRTRGRLWLAGVAADWHLLDEGRRRRLPLPTYPFQRRRYWVDPGEMSAGGVDLRRRPHLEDWFFHPTWRRTLAPTAGAPRADGETWLLFADVHGVADSLAKRLRERGIRSFVARDVGSPPAVEGPDELHLESRSADAYLRLLDGLEDAGHFPRRVLHLGSLTRSAGECSFAEHQERGFLGVLWLAQALTRHPAARMPGLDILSNGLHDVTGGEELVAANSTLLGAASVIPQELPGVRARILDLSSADLTSPNSPGQVSLDALIDDLLTPVDDEPVLAWRGAHRWARVFEPAPLEASTPSSPALREGGVYLITGGLGGLGRLFSGDLARRYKARLILVQSSPIPPRESWDACLRERDVETSDRAAWRRVEALRELEAAGAETLVVQADMADPEAVRRAVAAGRERFGRIDGVLHAAGLSGGALIHDQSRERVDRVFGPKVLGAIHLDQALDDDPPDFMVLFSSLSAFLGDVGGIEYAAANAFLDGFGQARNRRGRRTVVINWCTWSETGMVVGLSEDRPRDREITLALRLGLPSRDGLEAFHRILGRGAAQMAVSTQDLQSLADHQAALLRSASASRDDESPTLELHHPRPSLASAFVAPRDPVEERLAAIWREVLLVEEVGVDDNFVDLGGDSLLSLQVVAKARRQGLVLSLALIFEHPTVARLAEVLGRTSPDAAVAEPAAPRRAAEPSAPSAALLAELAAEGFDPRRVEDVYPLSPLQEGLLYHALLAPDDDVYLRHLSYEIVASLDVDDFRRAWQVVIDRHAALRTGFDWEHRDVPRQVVVRGAELPFALHDWRGESEAERQRLLDRLLEADLDQAFDLKRPPLTRVTLARTADDRFVCVWTFHHLVMDGWSMARVLSEIPPLYLALRRGEPSPLPPPLPYRAYIDWVRRQDMAAAEKFWREELAGFAAPTPIGEAERETAEPGEVHDLHFHLDRDRTAALRSWAGGLGLTSGTLLHALWSLFLSRYSGERDVLFGVVFSGRPDEVAGIESTVGLTANNLPVRVDVPRRQSLAAWLAEVQRRGVRLHAYQFSPLAQVQRWSELDNGVPLFHSVMALESFPRAAAAAGGERRLLEVRDIRSNEMTNYKVTLLAEVEAEFRVRLLLDPGAFDATTARRAVGHLKTLLAAFPDSGERSLAELPMLTAAERHQVLIEQNDTRLDEPIEELIHQPFERQSELTPDAVAVVCGTEYLTYTELERRSRGWAARLRQLGLRPADKVGVYLPRGTEMLVALLAALKAGGVYVPLTTSYPVARRRWILESQAVRFLLTHGVLGEDMADAAEHVLHLDGPMPAAPPGAIDPGLGVDELAYIIFTSGSSGVPKGVMVSHRPVINLLRWVNRRFEVDSEDRLLFVTAPTFDLSVYDIFGILAAGGVVDVATEDELAEPAALVDALADRRITFWDSAPAALQQLVPSLEAADLTDLGALRLVFLSGDWIPLTLPDAVRDAFGGCEVISLGGATEAAIWSNVFPVGEVAPEWVSIPYGRPITNARYHVLDSGFQPCPIGIAGDLYIGGDCLASGYAADPVLSAGKFLPDPFSESPSARLYSTGDRARYGADGLLEFLGRLNQQVKIRGFRIELGEVEAALARHPGVRLAVAFARGERLAVKQLVAVVEPRAEGAAPIEELLSLVKESLPSYMVPTRILAVDAIPVTANGKVDRKALLALEEADRDQAGNAARPPRDALELELVGLWEELLEIGGVGIGDHFFDLGGHSLLAVRLLAHLRGRFACELSLGELLRAGTVEGLAAILRERKTADHTSLVPLVRAASGIPLVLVHPGGGTITCYWELARQLGDDRPVYALQSRGLADGRFLTSVEEMAQAYLGELRAAHPSGPYALAGWSFGGYVAFEMARRLRAEDGDGAVVLLGMLDTTIGDTDGEELVAEDHLEDFLRDQFPDLEISDVARPDGTGAEEADGVDAKLRRLVDALAETGALPPGFGLDEARRHFDLYATNLQALASYSAGHYAGILTAFATSQRSDPAMGWQAHAARVAACRIPGEHATLLKTPHISAVAELFRKLLNDSEPREV